MLLKSILREQDRVVSFRILRSLVFILESPALIEVPCSRALWAGVIEYRMASVVGFLVVCCV